MRTLTPIGQLDPVRLREIVAKAALNRLPAGTRLFKTGDHDDWTIYLVRGEVELTYKEGPAEKVGGGTVGAQMPLAPQHPRKAAARAISEIEIVRISSSLLDVLTHTPHSSNYDVDEVHQDDEQSENRLLYEIFADHIADRLQVPVLPNVALHIRRAVGNPDVSVSDVVRIVTADPAVAARLLQVVNSAAYRRAAPSRTCRDAIAFLGLSRTKEIVTGLALKQLFQSRAPTLKARMKDVWRHSVRVAAISHVLAKLTPGLSADRALLAGLIHNLGSLPVLAAAERYPELCSNASQLDLAISKLRGQIGARILRRWGFPSDMVTVTLEAEDWHRDPGPKPDYCDVVLVAKLLNASVSSQSHEYPKTTDLPAYKKLAPGKLTSQGAFEILHHAADTLRELQQTLAG